MTDRPKVTPGGPPPGPVLHRNVAVIEVDDPYLLHELRANPRLSRLLVGQLTDRVALVRRHSADSIIRELRNAGYTPKVIRDEKTGIH